jgi:hypothetical protein
VTRKIPDQPRIPDPAGSGTFKRKTIIAARTVRPSALQRITASNGIMVSEEPLYSASVSIGKVLTI